MAKGLTSGYSPLGAMAVSDRLVEPFLHGESFLHGVTFGGHPVSAAVALANIDVFEKEGLLEHVRSNEAAFRASLDTLSRPAHRRRRPGGGLLLRDRAGQGQGHPGDLRRRRGRAAAAGLPVRRPLRRRSDLPGRRPGRPGGPAGASAHLRRGGVRGDDLHPALGADRGVEADLSPPSGERYRRLSLWWDGLPGPDRRAGRRCPATSTSTWPWWAAGSPDCGPPTTWPRPTRPCASPSSSGTWSASGRRGATADGARRCSRRPRSAWTAWPGPGPATAMRRAMEETVDEVGRVVEAEGIECDFAQGGTVVLARTAVQLATGPRRGGRRPGRGASARTTSGSCRRPRPRPWWGPPTSSAAPTPRTAPPSIRPVWSGAWPRRWSAGASPSTNGPRSGPSGPGAVDTDRGTVRAATVVRATEGYTRTLRGRGAHPGAGVLADDRHRAPPRRVLGRGRTGRAGRPSPTTAT